MQTPPGSPQAQAADEDEAPDSPRSMSTPEMCSVFPSNTTSFVYHMYHPNCRPLIPPQAGKPLHNFNTFMRVEWVGMLRITRRHGPYFDMERGYILWLQARTVQQKMIVKSVRLLLKLYQLGYSVETYRSIEVAALHPVVVNTINVRNTDVLMFRQETAFMNGTVIATRLNEPPYAVVETMSISNQHMLLFEKWQQYCSSGIPFYFLLDLYEYEKCGTARVIVGALQDFHGAEQYSNGLPDPRSWPDHLKRCYPGPRYYKKVFRDNEVIDIGPFSAHPVTPTILVNPHALSLMCHQLLNVYLGSDLDLEGDNDGET